MHWVNTLYSLFQFSYIHAFYKSNNIITNLIFKVSQINTPLWTHMGHKEWREDGKNCYTIALKFWDEFNANFFCYIFQVIGQ